MEKEKGPGALLVRLEAKNRLLFHTFYSAFVLEFSFLAVIVMLWLIRSVSGGFSTLTNAINWFEPIEIACCCLILPVSLGILHFIDCRRSRVYVYFRSLGWVLAACMPLTLLVGSVNDLLATALLSEQGMSFSPQMLLILLAACALVCIFVGLVFQVILIFIRARNE